MAIQISSTIHYHCLELEFLIACPHFVYKSSSYVFPTKLNSMVNNFSIELFPPPPPREKVFNVVFPSTDCELTLKNQDKGQKYRF